MQEFADGGTLRRALDRGMFHDPYSGYPRMVGAGGPARPVGVACLPCSPQQRLLGCCCKSLLRASFGAGKGPLRDPSSSKRLNGVWNRVVIQLGVQLEAPSR